MLMGGSTIFFGRFAYGRRRNGVIIKRDMTQTGVFGAAASESVDGGLRDARIASIAIPFVTRSSQRGGG
jgi:hypothetical protein